MQLFAGRSDRFVRRATQGRIAEDMARYFVATLGSAPSESEKRSWEQSLAHLADSVHEASLEDTGIIIEYRLPRGSQRLDAMLLGLDPRGQEHGVIVELKQWDAAQSVGVEDCVGLHDQDLRLHPSRQAGAYAEYLEGMHTAFYSDTGGPHVQLSACSFLHNASAATCGDLLSPEFGATLNRYPLFTGDLRGEFEAYLGERVGEGRGEPVLEKVLRGPYRPSRKLLDHVAIMIEGNPTFDLLDEQLIAFNVVRSRVRAFQDQPGRAVCIVKGGPGTGKSVIAMRLLGALAREAYNVVHCTGSKAFTTNLRAQVGRQASVVFKYFNSFMQEQPDSIDVLIADEAHRIRESSNSRWTRKDQRSDRSQIEELIEVAKVSIFLLDDNQVVRPFEVGTPDLIANTARRMGAEVRTIDLRAQFRCSGSESYLRWIDHLFGLGGDPDLSWRDQEEYEFVICDSVEELEQRVQQRAAEGHTARMVAGFCWPWSDPRRDGSLVPDVEIGDWIRPWNRKEKGNEPPHRHPYTLWAMEDSGLDEVGCIYSAQGFEFDYCGVIIGPDLVWDAARGEWRGQAGMSHDSVVKRSRDLARLLANTYRVLMTRGMQGTYVYFMDEATRNYVEGILAATKSST